MRSLLLTSSGIALALPAVASAQSTTSPAATAPAPSETAASADSSAAQPTQGLGEIIVTAQRRAESSQRAAVAVDVVQGADLVKAGITQIDRLNEQVPALTVEPTSTGNLIFIRGIGNFTVTPNSDPASAFNYDGVYIGRPTGTTGVFFDLDRVEVLKGPQGTLYGRNATGGAINVLPVQPRMGELSGYASVSYGRYDAVVAEGAINAPLGQDGAVRVSAMRSTHDGYFRDGTSDENQTSARIQMKAKLTPELTARISFDYSRTGGIGTSVTYLGNYNYVPAAGAYVFKPSNLSLAEGILTSAAQSFRQTVNAGPAGRKLDPLIIAPFQRNDFYGSNAQIDWQTGIGTVTIVPAWRHAGLNFLSTAGSFAYRNREQDEQYSIEARLVGKRIGLFDYQLGGFFYRETIDANTRLTTSASLTLLNQRFRTDSFAPFGRVTANLSDRLRLVGGARYTRDHKTFFGTTISGTIVCQLRMAGVATCPSAPLFPLVDTPAQLPFAFPAAGGPPQPLLVNGIPTGAVAVRVDRLDDSRLTNTRTTYRGAVEFDVAPRSLAYASVESGYRSGGFSAATGFETYQPEYITAYTIGSKNRFFDNRVQFNVEAFWWDYRNQQISAVRLDLAGRTANITQNIGKARIRGIEADGRVLVTPTTLLSADVQYLDAKNKSFSYTAQNSGVPPLTGCPVTLNVAANNYTINCAGFPSYNSPKWTISLAAQQTFNVGDYKIVFGADTQYRGRRYAGFLYLAQENLPSVWRTDAQASFGPANDRWSVSAFIRNIEDHRTPVYESTQPIANALITGTTAPRTYGVRASAKF